MPLIATGPATNYVEVPTTIYPKETCPGSDGHDEKCLKGGLVPSRSRKGATPTADSGVPCRPSTQSTTHIRPNSKRINPHAGQTANHAAGIESAIVEPGADVGGLVSSGEVTALI